MKPNLGEGSLFPPPVSVLANPTGAYPAPAGEPTSLPIHWLGDDGLNVFLEIQGQFVAVAIRKGPAKKKPAKRGMIYSFSPASRLRMFKKINRIDMVANGRCTFSTCTWRDELGRPTPERITLARSWCHRSLERITGRQLGAIWRVEWKLRLSGRYMDEYMPHVHTLYFGVPYIPWQDWSAAWSQAVGTKEPCSLKLEEIVNLRKCLYYVSKYIAKVDCLSNLDIPSYLNNHLRGRKWGIYREDAIKLAPLMECRFPPGPLLEAIREVATRHWADTPQVEDKGFTIFGPAADEIRKLVEGWTGHLPDGSIG